MRVRRCIVALVLFVLPCMAFAHPGGQTLEKQVGDYLVDVGYDTFDFQPEQQTVFNFILITNAKKPAWEFAPVDVVHVQITGGDGETFSRDIPLDAPVPVYVPYTFKIKGTYTLSVRFESSGKVLAETDFPLPVGVSGFSMQNAVFVVVGFINLGIVGAVAAAWWAKKTKRSSIQK